MTRKEKTDWQRMDRKEHPDKYRQAQKRHYDKLKKMSPDKISFKRLRSSARARGLSFEISYHDMPTTEKLCPVLHIPLVPSDNFATANSPSFDRIDSTKGYTQGNIRCISWRANRLKSDATAEESFLLAEDAGRIEAKKWIWDRVILLPSTQDPMDYP